MWVALIKRQKFFECVFTHVISILIIQKCLLLENSWETKKKQHNVHTHVQQTKQLSCAFAEIIALSFSLSTFLPLSEYRSLVSYSMVLIFWWCYCCRCFCFFLVLPALSPSSLLSWAILCKIKHLTNVHRRVKRVFSKNVREREIFFSRADANENNNKKYQQSKLNHVFGVLHPIFHVCCNAYLQYVIRCVGFSFCVLCTTRSHSHFTYSVKQRSLTAASLEYVWYAWNTSKHSELRSDANKQSSTKMNGQSRKRVRERERKNFF